MTTTTTLSKAEQNKLVADNIGLAQKVAREFANATAHDFDDLLQEACLGLMRAAKSWNPERTKYSTWGTCNARWACSDYCRVKGRLVKLPGAVHSKVVVPGCRLRAEGLSDKEICERLGIGTDEWDAVMTGHGSLDFPVGHQEGEEETTLADVLPREEGEERMLKSAPSTVRVFLDGVSNAELKGVHQIAEGGRVGRVRYLELFCLLIDLSEGMSS